MQYILMILILISITINAKENDNLKIIIEKNVLKDYKKFIQNDNPLNVIDFNKPGSRRSVVDFILFQQALFLGGYKTKYEFIVSPTSLRKLILVKEAKGITSSTSLWLYNLEKYKDNIYISHPVIRNNEFEAGLYTLSTNKKILNSKNLNDIQELTAISNKNWVPDWETLESLKLKRLISTLKWKQMTRMIKAKRGDFLLAPFQQTSDLSFETEGVKFLPIPNLKVGLKGSRHFAISKKYKNSKEILKSLNIGLKILIEKGTIKKAYTESGFFNKKVKKWKILKLNNSTIIQ